MSRRHGIRLLLAALLAISLPALIGCAVKPDRPAPDDGQLPAETPEETPEQAPDAQPATAAEETPEEPKEPEESKREEAAADEEPTVRVAIRLASPPLTQAGFRLNSIAKDPEAKAYQEKLRKEQDEMIRRIEETLGHPIAVMQRLTRSANVISANVRPSDIDVIRAMDGVLGVTEEILNEPTGMTPSVPTMPGRTTTG